MDITSATKQEINSYLYEGNELIVYLNNDEMLSKVLWFYTDYLEKMHTEMRFTANRGQLYLLFYTTINTLNIIYLNTRYSYLKSIGYAWGNLGYISATADTMHPSQTFTFKYHGDRNSMPRRLHHA